MYTNVKTRNTSNDLLQSDYLCKYQPKIEHWQHPRTFTPGLQLQFSVYHSKHYPGLDCKCFLIFPSDFST